MRNVRGIALVGPGPGLGLGPHFLQQACRHFCILYVQQDYVHFNGIHPGGVGERCTALYAIITMTPEPKQSVIWGSIWRHLGGI